MQKQIVIDPYLFKDLQAGDTVVFVGHPESDSYLYIDKKSVFGDDDYFIGPGGVLQLKVLDPEEFHWIIEPEPRAAQARAFNGSGGRYP